MRNKDIHKARYNNTLLLFFGCGALLRILYGEGIAALLPELSFSWIRAAAILLLLDALMIASLAAWHFLPLTSVAFGCLTAAKAREILASGPLDEWRTILILALVIPLHFLIGAWSLGVSDEIHTLLRGRKAERRLCTVSLLLRISAAVACILLVFLESCKYI